MPACGGTLVFDASTPIAISYIRRPDMFDLFRNMGYELAVPSHVEREELIGANVRAMIRDLLDRGTVRIVRANSRKEVLDLRANFHGMGLGECDAILACIKMRRSGEGARCVLDDKKPRAAARQIGIDHVGLAGLLGELASAGAVPASEMDRIVEALRRSSFYMGDGLLDGLGCGI